MDITYTTVVKNLRIAPSVANCSNVITHVRFSYEATDGVNTTRVPQVIEFNMSSLDANSFVDIANVTTEMVESWIVNTISADTVNAMQSMLNTQLAGAANVVKTPAWTTLGVLQTVQSANTANT